MEQRIDKAKLNHWISELDNIHQLKALRSIIASAPNRDAIWDELSQEAQEDLRSDDEVEKTDVQFTPAKFWQLVWSLKESSRSVAWDDLPEETKTGIIKGRQDIEEGRFHTSEEMWEEIKK